MASGKTNVVKNKAMHWTENHDEIFIREVLLFEPWQHRKGSQERGNTWKAVAESLSQMTAVYFRVDDRAVRDRFKVLEKKYVKKRNEEKRETGVDVPEETETEKRLADIIELFKDSDAKQNEEKEKKKETVEKEAHQAEEFRRQSLETIGETRKRNAEERSGKGGKRRRSDETIEYLRGKSKQEKELKDREFELKKTELNDRREESKAFQGMMLQQQQQNSALLQQQQQVNITLLQFLAPQQNNEQ